MRARIPVVSLMGRGPKGEKGDPGEATEHFLEEIRAEITKTVNGFTGPMLETMERFAGFESDMNGFMDRFRDQAESCMETASAAAQAAIDAADKVSAAVANLAEHGFSADTGALGIESGGTGATTKEDAMGNLGVSDYVVDSGSDRGWTYRVWASGRLEQYYTGAANHFISNKQGDLFISNKVDVMNKAFPRVFSDVPNVRVSALPKDHTYIAWATPAYGTTTEEFGGYYLMRGTSRAEYMHYQVHIECIGWIREE